MNIDERIQEISSKHDFENVLFLSKAAIYFLALWSGEAVATVRIIEKIVYESPNFVTPVFKIDMSEEEKPYVHEWLAKQTPKIVLRGGGEIVLIETGIVVDFIRQMCYPGVATNNGKIDTWLQ